MGINLKRQKNHSRLLNETGFYSVEPLFDTIYAQPLFPYTYSGLPLIRPPLGPVSVMIRGVASFQG